MGAAIATTVLTTEPLVLRPDNFTPPRRTPWGGHRIQAHYKSGLVVPVTRGVVGESWEISAEPSFPSRVAGGETLLSQVISESPTAWLGARSVARYGPQTSMLVKLLDTEDNLSVQVHPEDDDPGLAADESGKPEAWVVLEARPGASIYLGFRKHVSRSDVLACLARSGPLNRLMNRVFVKPGDAFVIPPGTPHAIGSGVTLIEPQIVRPGRRGLTYRFWDWNRRYNDQGVQDDNGQPRHLHIERSMEVTHWSGLRGPDMVKACRAVAYPTRMPGRRVVIDWSWFKVERWDGSHTFPVASVGSMWNLTCTAGSAEILWAGGRLHLRRGQSAVVPADCDLFEVRGRDMTVFASCAEPKAASR